MQIIGSCPMCGGSLSVGSDGYITCSAIRCPNPTKVADLLLDREREHIVTFTEHSWTIRHPLREHPNGLETCPVHAYCAELAGPPVRPGRYRAAGDKAPFHWTRLEDEKEGGLTCP